MCRPPVKIRASQSDSDSRGFALIMVMIVVISLSALLAGFAIAMNTEVRLARNSDYDEKMEWMARSGIEEARCLLANKSPEQKNIDALNQYWAGGPNIGSNDLSMLIPLKDEPVGEGTRTLIIEDMERKWDINIVAGAIGQPQREILQRAFTVIGVTDTGLAATIEDSILDWVRPNNGGSLQNFNGANSEYYTHLEPNPYFCKGGQIDDLTELLLIKGINQDIYWGPTSSNHPPSAYSQRGLVGGSSHFGHNRDEPAYQHGLVDLFSPLGGKLNINTASVLTLQLIPGMDESVAAHIIQQRAGPDGIDGTDDDIPFQNIGEINGGFQGGQRPGNIPGGPPGGVATQGMGAYIDVRSYVFSVHVICKINDYQQDYYGVVSRMGNNAQQLKCVKFYTK